MNVGKQKVLSGDKKKGCLAQIKKPMCLHSLNTCIRTTTGKHIFSPDTNGKSFTHFAAKQRKKEKKKKKKKKKDTKQEVKGYSWPLAGVKGESQTTSCCISTNS